MPGQEITCATTYGHVTGVYIGSTVLLVLYMANQLTCLKSLPPRCKPSCWSASTPKAAANTSVCCGVCNFSFLHLPLFLVALCARESGSRALVVSEKQQSHVCRHSYWSGQAEEGIQCKTPAAPHLRILDRVYWLESDWTLSRPDCQAVQLASQSLSLAHARSHKVRHTTMKQLA